jgi:hypothetical protein
MSGWNNLLSLAEEDLTKILVAAAHLGSQNLDHQMAQYVYKRTKAGKKIDFSFFLCCDPTDRKYSENVFPIISLANVHSKVSTSSMYARCGIKLYWLHVLSHQSKTQPIYALYLQDKLANVVFSSLPNTQVTIYFHCSHAFFFFLVLFYLMPTPGYNDECLRAGYLS